MFGKYQDINFLIIAGLAGGTGRGCWELIAFKLREMFTRYGRAPTPRAFLFDATLFFDIYDSLPGQKLPMMVNSLTGLSQLSCWTLNRQAGHQYSGKSYVYRLPNMQTPHSPETDVLNVTLELDVNNAAPVDHAYLIFKDNQMVSLANHYQYYEMVAAGIYAALSKSALMRQEINQRSSYVGIAAATLEVSAVSLRKYFEAMARVQATKKLLKTDNAAVDKSVDDFLRTKATIGVTAQDPYTQYKPDPQGTLVQKLLARMEVKSRPKLVNLEDAMRRQNKEDARRYVRGAMLQDDALVQDCFREVLAEEESNLVQVVLELANDLLEGTQSIGTVCRFMENVVQGLQVEIEALPSEIPPEEDPVQLLEELADREIPIWWKIFSEEEIKKQLEVTRAAMPCAQYPIIRRLLRQHYQSTIDRLQAILDNLNDACNCLKKLQWQFERSCQSSVEGIPSTDRVENWLFTPPDHPEKGLAERFAQKRFYRRELKPFLTADHALELLDEHVRIDRQVVAYLKGVLSRPRPSDRLAAQEDMRRELERLLASTVGITAEFIVENFSLRKIIQDAVKCWRQRLQQQMSDDERNHLESRFQETFGFRPTRRRDSDRIEYQFPESVDDVLCRIAASLASTCKPFWVLSRKWDDRYNVVVFLPSNLDQAQLAYKVQTYLGDMASSLDVEVYPESPDATDQLGTYNPFVLVAYSSQGVESLEEIESVKYYNESGVLQTLRDAERDDGKTIFEGGRNGGLGYTDPLYVRDPDVRKMRWKPWCIEDTSVVEQENQQAADALLYALFPGDKPTETLDRIKQQVQQLGWKLPLIEHGGRGRFQFTRPPLVFSNGVARIDPNLAGLEGWDDSRPVATTAGIARVFDVLLGREAGRPQGTQWRQRILQEAEQFWKQVLLTVNVAEGSPSFREMLQDYLDWLGEKARQAEEESEARKVWQLLVQRVQDRMGA
jgi:hypothetical protein